MSLLTVCIPTFNRSALLVECLEALIPQLAPHGIPICVADNGSTDATRAAVSRVRDTRYPHIRYTASTQNDRIDRNILRAVGMADTRYAWIFGDDDRVAPGAVDRVLAALVAQPAVVYVNRSEWRADMRAKVRDRTLKLDSDVTVTDANLLLAQFAPYITFVGALVVDVARWKAIDPSPYLDTDFVHVGIVHEYFTNDDLAHVIAEPLIDCRLGNATWSERYFEVWFVNWPAALNRLPARYSRQARVAATRAILDGSIATLLSARANGSYGSRQFSELVAPLYARGEWRRSVARVLTWVPRPLARTVTTLQRGVRRWHHARALKSTVSVS